MPLHRSTLDPAWLHKKQTRGWESVPGGHSQEINPVRLFILTTVIHNLFNPFLVTEEEPKFHSTSSSLPANLPLASGSSLDLCSQIQMSFSAMDSSRRGTQRCHRKDRTAGHLAGKNGSVGAGKRLFSYHSGFTRKPVQSEEGRRVEVRVTWGAVNQASSLRQVFACSSPHLCFPHPTPALLPGTSGQVTTEPSPTTLRMLRGWPLGSQRITQTQEGH